MTMDELELPLDNWDFVPQPSSQTSTYSNSLLLDSAGLMALCSQENQGWIADSSQPIYTQDYTVQVNGSQQFATIPSTSTAVGTSQASSTVFTNTAELDGYLDLFGSVALSPESIPPASPNSSTDGDTMPGPDSQEIMKILDETLDSPDVEIIAQNLAFELFTSSQGNEFLSQETRSGDLKDLVMMRNTSDGQDLKACSVDTAVVLASTLPVDEIQAPAPIASTSKPSNKRKRSDEVATSSSKKRNQNKEAAKRYREKKKNESVEHATKLAELEAEKKEKIQKIMRQFTEVESSLRVLAAHGKPNAHFKFPDWLTFESD